MGLSASQARLLSITARISDNELHSQQIANSKVRLADKTQEASREYVQALDSQKLVFTTYDAKGNATQVNLTPSLLYDYSTIKNQYGISNSVGQLLISTEMAEKYQTSKTLLDFLKANGCDVKENGDYSYWLNVLRGTNDKTENTIIGYYNQVGTIDLSTVDAVLVKSPEQITNDDATAINNFMNTFRGRITNNMRDCNGSFGVYIDSLETFNLAFPNIDDPKYHVIDPITGKGYDYLYGNASHGCASGAMNKSIDTNGDGINDGYNYNCFKHVLAHLLLDSKDLIPSNRVGKIGVAETYSKTYTNSIGGKIEIKGNTSAINDNGINGSTRSGQSDTKSMAIVADYLRDSGITVEETPDPDLSYISDETEREKVQKLISCKNELGVLKTYRQQVIDMYTLLEMRTSSMKEAGLIRSVTDSSTGEIKYPNEYYDSCKVNTTNYPCKDETLLRFIIDFQSNLNSSLSFENLYNRDVANWQATLQSWKDEFILARDKYLTDIANMPEKEIPANDDYKTQWYINLWNRLNGSSNENVNYDQYATKESGQKWKVLENSLFKSQSWMQYALEQGLISLEQVQYVENADDSTGLKTSKWESKEYATCVDIKFVDDETAIARAEAIYTRKLNEIEAQDKKFDNEIKKLDTEHTALQTEYDSVKSVVDKNVERSFKAFS